VLANAHAFWLREPGRGEIRPVVLPEPGCGDVVVRTLRSGVSRGTETLVFLGGVPPSQYAAMRAPFQEGDFPGPVKYLPNVGAVEQGPPEPRPHGLRLYPHQTAYVVPASAVTVVPETCRPGAPCSPAPWRPPSAPGTRPRLSVTRRGRRRRDGRLLRRPPPRQFPAVEVTLVDVDASRAEVATALGAGFARPKTPPAVRPGRAHERDVGRAAALARAARARGTVRAQLVRRHRGAALAGRRVPRGPPGLRASGSGRCPRPGRAARRPTGPRSTCCATPFRCARDRRVALDELPGVMARRGSLPALCHTITYEGG
jgi:hypothetical protein